MKGKVISPFIHLDPWGESNGAINVVIETPKGSRNKYGFDAAHGVFRLKGVLPEGMSFPHDFGFIPRTIGEDGDALDVLLFLDAGTPIGTVLEARLLGVIEAEQTESDGATLRNDRLIAVATHTMDYSEMRGLEDLRPGMLDELEAFFSQYNKLHGKEFRALNRGTPSRARAIVEMGILSFKKRDEDS